MHDLHQPRKTVTAMTTTDPSPNSGDVTRSAGWPAKALALSALSFLPACTSSTAFIWTAPAEIVERVAAATTVPDTGSAADTSEEAEAATGTADFTGTTALEARPASTPAPAAAAADNPGFMRLNQSTPADSAVRTAVLTQDANDESRSPRIIPLSHQVGPIVEQCDPRCFTPAEPRIDPALTCASPCDLYPDEYLADGGDRRLPVHYFAGDRQGFDTEDTIAEYSDHQGDTHVRASNRVCVYAPRFGSVQVIEGAGSGTQIHHAANTTDFSAVGSLERQEGSQQSVHEEGFAAVRSRRRADGAENQRNAVHAHATARAQQNDKIDQGLQAEATTGMQIFERLQGPHFHQELANAVIWSRDLFPKMSAGTSQAGEARTRITAQATIGIEDQRAEKSDIHLVKLADRDTAEAGDTIQFTIRFINTGDYDLYDVQIVDNLTPRLELLPDTLETDRDGDFQTQPNGEGSEIITFVLDEPLPAHESGTIRFSVRVK